MIVHYGVSYTKNPVAVGSYPSCTGCAFDSDGPGCVSINLKNSCDGVIFIRAEAETRTESTKPMLLSADPAERKAMPITTGVLDYFPLAIAEVAVVSKTGNDQHNPGQPLHWSKGKSTDHADCIARHLIDRGSRDTDGMRHSAKLAWRALAALQIELEAEAAV